MSYKKQLVDTVGELYYTDIMDHQAVGIERLTCVQVYWSPYQQKFAFKTLEHYYHYI